VLLALQGFIYDGPKGIIGFKPVWQPEDHVSFFTGAEGWGVFRQKRVAGSQIMRIELNYGCLTLRELVFELPAGMAVRTVSVAVGNQQVLFKYFISGTELRIMTDKAMTLQAADNLVVEMR